MNLVRRSKKPNELASDLLHTTLSLSTNLPNTKAEVLIIRSGCAIDIFERINRQGRYDLIAASVSETFDLNALKNIIDRNR